MLKKILLSLLLITLLTSCWDEIAEKEVKKSFSTYIVKTGHISNSSRFTGYTSGTKEVMLATKSPWRIVYLNKNVWDKVKKGELLARLDWAEAKTGYSTANSIVNSLYSLRKQTWLAYDGQIAAVNAKIAQAKIWIKWVTIGLEDTKKITASQLITAKTWVEQAELWLETAKTNLEKTEQTLVTNKKNILDWGKTAITQAIILYKNIVDFSDKTLWVTKENKRANDKFEDYLWGKDTTHLKETEILFKTTKTDFDAFEKYYNDFIDNKNPSEEEIINWLKIAEITATKQKTLLKELYTVLDDSIDNIYFPAEMINEYKKNISTMGSQVESTLLTVDWSFILWIKWTLQNLETFNSQKDKWISLLKKQVELAKAGLETAKKTLIQYENMSNWQVNWVVVKKEIAEAQLKEAYEWLKAIKAKKQASLKEIDAKIAEAKGWKNLALNMINNWKVFSNISWIITQKMAEVWQVTNAWMPLYKVVDTSSLKVKTSIPNNIYKNLKTGQKIDLVVEWFNKKITWKISLISKSANRFTKKYDIEIEINNSKGEIPLWAMAMIQIKEKSKSKKVSNPIIPNNAIISKFSLPAVYVLKNWKATLKTIKIIKMGAKKSEITWIKSLDKIITSWKENIYDWEVLEEVKKEEKKDKKKENK